jgi:hypothetical protein
MPSTLHEGLAEVFRDQPELAAHLLAANLGVPLPRFSAAQLSAADLTDVAPTEFRADAVVTLSRAGKSVYAVVIEVQLRVDPRKRETWPVYVATVHARLQCPVSLLVICPTARVADWCAKPIMIGDGVLTVRPVVLGPRQTPMVVDVKHARRHPLLAVISACVHGREDRPAVFTALLAALDSIEPDRAKMYIGVVFSVLPPARRARLEEFMTTAAEQRTSDFAREYMSKTWAKGEAMGEAKALLKVLAARGVDVPDPVRAEIMACTDTDQLDAWIDRAATAQSIQDVLG